MKNVQIASLPKAKHEHIFKNIEFIYNWHKKIFLPQLLEFSHSIDKIGQLFIDNVIQFYNLIYLKSSGLPVQSVNTYKNFRILIWCGVH